METFVELGGPARVYVETMGDGPPAMVVPVPWGASHDLYEALLGPLGLPMAVTYFDPEGTGASSPLPPGWNPARILDELEAVVRFVGAGMPVSLIGHAGGAFMAMAFALEWPELVSSLILISPFTGYRRASDMSTARLETHPEWARFQERVATIRSVQLTAAERSRAIFKEQHAVDMFDYAPHYFQMADAADETDFNPAMHDDTETDLLDDVHQIQVPVLIVTGEDDPLSPLEEARLIAGELPFVRLVEFPRCGHYPFVEYPELFADAVSEFVREVEGDEQ